MSAGGRGRPPLRRNDRSRTRRGRRPRRPAVRPAPGYPRLRRGGACPSRGFRTAPDISHHPVGDGVLDVPFLQPSSMSAGGRGRPPLRRDDRSRTRRGRRPRRPAVRPAPGYTRLRRGGACPSRGFRTTPNISHHPVGDGVPDVPQIRTRTHGLTPVGADAPGGPSVRHSTMSAGGRGRPPLRRNDRSRTRRGRRPRRPAVRPAPGNTRLRRGGACPSRGFRTAPAFLHHPAGAAVGRPAFCVLLQGDGCAARA